MTADVLPARTSVEDGWVYVHRTDGLAAGTYGNWMLQAAVAVLRVRAALRRHGLDLRLITAGRWLVPHGGAVVRDLGPDAGGLTLPTAFVALGLFAPGAMVELEVRAPQLRGCDET